MSLNAPLSNRVALLTGASRGIGGSLARALAKEGICLILAATRERHLHHTLEACREFGTEAVGLEADLTDPAQVVTLAEQAQAVYGRLDFLINNAGVGYQKTLLETSTEEWDRCFAVNARAPFLLSKTLAPLLSQSDRATIVNIGSVVAHKGYARQGAYSASKHALLGLSKVLALELASMGIRVHTLHPGGVATEMIEEMRPDLDPAGLIRPDELAEWVVFLLRNQNSAVVDDLRIRRASGDPWF